MALKRVTNDLYILPLGAANAYLIETQQGLVLIDTGFPDKADVVPKAIQELGRTPKDLRDIILTHAHVDHIGSLAALVAATQAATWMHALDIPVAERGSGFRPMQSAPGLLHGVLFRLFVRPGQTVAPVSIDHAVADGDVLPVAGGLRAIHVPGHCLGQVALLWQERGVLFAGDAFANIMGVGDPLGFEDQAEGRRSQNKLAALDFRIACFGHGKPVLDGDASRLRERFAAALRADRLHPQEWRTSPPEGEGGGDRRLVRSGWRRGPSPRAGTTPPPWPKPEAATSCAGRSRLRAELRRAAARIIDSVRDAIRDALPRFTSQGCASHSAAAGYEPE